MSLPISLDYSLLRTLIVEQAFTEAQESVTLVNEGGGCVNLILSHPQVSEENGLIRLEMALFTRIGTPIGGNCFAPIEWQGVLVLHQQPKMANNNWQLSFSLVDAELQNSNRQSVKIANLLWRMIQSHALSYIDDIVIDLMPPVGELKAFLFPLFPDQVRENTIQMLESLRPGTFAVTTEALELSVLADVESVYDPTDTEILAPLDGAPLKKAISIWENWDGLLMYLVTVMSREALSVDEQHILRNVLLDSRYQFVQAEADKAITRDFVREQFVEAWEQLGPIFKRHLVTEDQGSRTLGYLAFVSSVDALLVFDRLGPTFGLEISRNGLIRLIHMLEADPTQLFHPSFVSPDLQKLFQMKSPSSKPPEVKSKEGAFLELLSRPLAQCVKLFQPAIACAAQPTFQDILKWKVPKKNVSTYVIRVTTLLDKSSHNKEFNKNIPKNRLPMFHKLIQAMAWQESCFRQFVVKGNKLTYLLSYNQSSVGLMQINERVWRGLFNRESLRWDIGYNADAGCEIAALYLQKYALSDATASRKIDNNTMARLVYAMYNGGPSQYRKFMDRLKKGKLYQSDELFWEKYQWVLAGDVDKVSMCLIGG